MATEQSPATFLAQVAASNDFLRSQGRPAQLSWLKVSKTGRVSIAHSESKATRFASAADAAAAAAITTRQAYESRTLGIDASDPDNLWTAVAA